MTTAPSVPQDATIATLSPQDGVGTLALADGSTLRFGASACRGFSPVVGAKVRVVASRPHPLGGFAAAALELAMDGAAYDALLAARDQALGIRRDDDPAQNASASMQLGWAVVLFDEPAPRARRPSRRGPRGSGSPRPASASTARRWRA